MRQMHCVLAAECYFWNCCLQLYIDLEHVNFLLGRLEGQGSGGSFLKSCGCAEK